MNSEDNAESSRLHFNYAGAGVPSAKMIDAVHGYLNLERCLGGYEAEAMYGESIVASARRSVASLLGTESERIALFDNATRAWSSLVTNLTLRAGDVIWVSEYDYAANLFVLAELRRRVGAEIIVIPSTPKGDLDLDWAAKNISNDVVLVSVSHIPACCGVVVDAAGLGEIVGNYRTLFVVDGCQAVGNVAVNVAHIGSDIYTGTGRKFLCGPRGTGFAYVSDKYISVASPTILDVHAMYMSPTLDTVSWVQTAPDFELVEKNIAVCAGLATAVDEHRAQDVSAIQKQRELFCVLENEICSLPGIRRLGEASMRSGIISIISNRKPAGELYSNLLMRGIRTWIGRGKHTPLFSHSQGAHEFLRISLGRRSTTDSVKTLLQEIAELV